MRVEGNATNDYLENFLFFHVIENRKKSIQVQACIHCTMKKLFVYAHKHNSSKKRFIPIIELEKK